MQRAARTHPQEGLAGPATARAEAPAGPSLQTSARLPAGAPASRVECQREVLEFLTPGGPPAASPRPAHHLLETRAREGYPETGRGGRRCRPTRLRGTICWETGLRSDGDEWEGHRVQGWGLGHEKEVTVSAVLGGRS